MSNCNCQKNIKKPNGDELSITTVATTVAGKPIGDGLPITTVAATVAEKPIEMGCS